MSSTDLPPEELSQPVKPPATRTRLNWPVLIGLLGPALVAIVAVRQGTWYSAPDITIQASVVGGLVATFFTLWRRPMVVWKKVLLALVLIPAFFVTSLIIAMFGCAISGSTR